MVSSIPVRASLFWRPWVALCCPSALHCIGTAAFQCSSRVCFNKATFVHLQFWGVMQVELNCNSMVDSAKGQLISKRPFGLFESSKIPMKFGNINSSRKSIMSKSLEWCMLHLCTLIFWYDIHKNEYKLRLLSWLVFVICGLIKVFFTKFFLHIANLSSQKL